jgi:glyoxylate/hydroxypyruvate reductase A
VSLRIFTNVEFTPAGQQRLVARLDGDAVHFGDPEQLTPADEAALLAAEVAFGSCPPGLLPAAAGLRWLQLDSVGCDQYQHLDWPVLGQRLVVTNLRGFFAIPVAESGIAGALALLRGLDELALLQRQRTWRPVELRSQLRTLAGCRAVVAGNGAIGRALAARLDAWDCEVVTFGSARSQADYTDLAGLDFALGSADLLFLALPETAATAGLFGRERLARLRPGAIVVNLGRGGLVDEAALVELLRDGALRGAVLDVTLDEPLRSDSALWSAPNLLLTQHTAGGSDGEVAGKADVFLANLARYRAGQPLAAVVDWARGY